MKFHKSERSFGLLLCAGLILSSCSSTSEPRRKNDVARTSEVKADWPLLSVERPPNGMIEPNGSKIEIYPDGRVVKISLRYVRGSQPVSRESELTTLAKELPAIKRCAAELGRVDFEAKRDACENEDEGETQYKAQHGEKEFAIRWCGHLQTAKGKCARSMVQLLDSLEQGSLK